ncbi:unnamed protein product, partial [Phaeothamnion confervicola]
AASPAPSIAGGGVANGFGASGDGGGYGTNGTGFGGYGSGGGGGGGGVDDGQWADIGAILAGSDEPKKRWLRSALRLLSAVCAGAHYGCQSAVSRLVPADMLLDLLGGSGAYGGYGGGSGGYGSGGGDGGYCNGYGGGGGNGGLGDGDQAILLDLLRSVYVEHDLVFPPEALVPSQAVAIAIAGEEFPIGVSGKVFNYMTQSPPPGRCRVGHAQIAAQRRRLMSLICAGLQGLRLDVFAYEPPRYADRCHAAVALLRLTRWLLRKGFFYRGGTDAPVGALGLGGLQAVVEEEVSWVGQQWVHRPSRLERAVAGARDALPPLPSQRQPLSSAAAAAAGATQQLLLRPRAPDQLLYHADLEDLLVEKCRAADAEHAGRGGYGGGGGGSGGGGGGNGDGFGGVAGMSGGPVGAARFDALFANPLIVDLKREVLASLEVLQAIRNLQGLKAVVHRAVGPEAATALAAPETVPQAGVFDDGVESADTRLDAAMEVMGQAVATGDEKLKAVMDLTLHGGASLLLQRAYRFCLTLTLNDVHFVNLLNRFAVVADPGVARTARTAHALAALFRKYSRNFGGYGGGYSHGGGSGGHGGGSGHFSGGGHCGGGEGDESTLDVLLFTLSVLAAISVQELRPRSAKEDKAAAVATAAASAAATAVSVEAAAGSTPGAAGSAAGAALSAAAGGAETFGSVAGVRPGRFESNSDDASVAGDGVGSAVGAMAPGPSGGGTLSRFEPFNNFGLARGSGWSSFGANRSGVSGGDSDGVIFAAAGISRHRSWDGPAVAGGSNSDGANGGEPTVAGRPTLAGAMTAAATRGREIGRSTSLRGLAAFTYAALDGPAYGRSRSGGANGRGFGNSDETSPMSHLLAASMSPSCSRGVDDSAIGSGADVGGFSGISNATGEAAPDDSIPSLHAP